MTQPALSEPETMRNPQQNHSSCPPLRATQLNKPLKHPYQQAPLVSPYHELNIPSGKEWNQIVSKCEEEVTLTYLLPHDMKELDQRTQPEAAFPWQIERNFKGYPAVRLQQCKVLNPEGSSIPVEYAMGWPPEYVEEGSTILYEKLTKTIPHTLWNILTTHLNGTTH